MQCPHNLLVTERGAPADAQVELAQPLSLRRAQALRRGVAQQFFGLGLEFVVEPVEGVLGGVRLARQFLDLLLELLLQIGDAVEDDEPLRYGGALGSPALRELLAARARLAGCEVGPEHFMLTNGSAGAIDAVCCALVQPGDVVLCEAPTFTGTVRTFRGHGAEVVGVPMDTDGVDIEALAREIDRLRRAGRRVVYEALMLTHRTGLRGSSRQGRPR